MTTLKQSEDTEQLNVQPVQPKKSGARTLQKKSTEQKPAIQAKQNHKPPIVTKEGQKPTIQAKNGSGKRLEPVKAKRGKPLQRKRGESNLPAQIRTNMESMGGVDLSDVKVHYNSSKPAEMDAQMNAQMPAGVVQNKKTPIQQKTEAFAQGSDVHLAPGMDKHLAHEAWHVVQQKQGRVQPTSTNGGVAINDSPALEQEADNMGDKAMQMKATEASPEQQSEISNPKSRKTTQQKVAQLKRHSLEGKGETGSGDWDGDDSFFEANTKAMIAPEKSGSASLMLPHLDTVDIPGKYMKNKGVITISTEMQSMIDQDYWYAVEDGGSEFVTKFNYHRKRNNVISLEFQEGSTMHEVQHAFEGKDGNNYTYVKKITKNDDGHLTFRTYFVKNVKHKTYDGKTISSVSSGTNLDGNLGYSIDSEVNPKLHIELDGNDVAMFFGAKKIPGGSYKSFSQKSRGFLGTEDLKQLLDKQKLEVDFSAKVKSHLEANFGFVYKSSSTTTTTQTEQTAYTTGGPLVQEVNELRIIQAPLAPTKNVFFDQEDQSTLTGQDKLALLDFLDKDSTQDMLGKVRNGQYQILLEGYASSTDTQEYNEEIAQKRIAAVRYLMMKREDLLAEHFTDLNLGETQAEQRFVDPGDRRVVVKFVKKRNETR
ncbi:MAG TPA: hypothetical protein DCS93_39590 [Microscillaceae bacterium]|nr:hypothetical protein [Microscillaceae bacterium]